MKKLLHVVLMSTCLLLNGCPQDEEEVEDTEQIDTDIYQQTVLDDSLLEEQLSPEEEEEQLRQEMEDEVISLWRIYLEDHDTGSKDKRWDVLDQFAHSLIKYVRKFQTEGVKKGKEIIRLPEHENVHLLLATMVIFETALYHEAVGPIGEVGLLQTHGVALNGFKPAYVQRNPDLGLMLGVRWLTLQLPHCERPSDSEWCDDDWLGPLSVYAGGLKKAKRNGKCLKFKVSKKRVEYTKYYRDRIDSSSSV